MGFYDLFGFFKGEVAEDIIRAGPPKPRPPTPGLNLPKGCYIPDYKIYKVENAPELLEVQKKLAARGLKSPWLRNDVWRYERFRVGSPRWRNWYLWGLGFKYGVPFTVIAILFDIYVKPPKPWEHQYTNLYYPQVKKSHDSHH